MKNENSVKLFESKKVRTHWDSKEEQWFFSLVDIVAALTDSANANNCLNYLPDIYRPNS